MDPKSERSHWNLYIPCLDHSMRDLSPIFTSSPPDWTRCCSVESQALRLQRFSAPYPSSSCRSVSRLASTGKTRAEATRCFVSRDDQTHQRMGKSVVVGCRVWKLEAGSTTPSALSRLCSIERRDSSLRLRQRLSAKRGTEYPRDEQSLVTLEGYSTSCAPSVDPVHV